MNQIHIDSSGLLVAAKSESTNWDSTMTSATNPDGLYTFIESETIWPMYGLNDMAPYYYRLFLNANGMSISNSRTLQNVIWLIGKYRNANKFVLARQYSSRRGFMPAQITRLVVAESVDIENNNFDIHLPELWRFKNIYNDAEFTIDFNDRDYQSQVWINGEADDNKNISDEITIVYSKELEDAENLGLNDKSGWDIFTPFEGPLMYYIDYIKSREINKKLVFQEEGPRFSVYKEVVEKFIKDADPEFDISKGYEIKFKKGNDLDDGVSFDSYQENTINNLDFPGIIYPDYFRKFGEPQWFADEQYRLTSFPDQDKFDAQESINGNPLFENVPDRASALNIENDQNINTSLIGTYKFYNKVNPFNEYLDRNYSSKYIDGTTDCGYLRKVLQFGENRHYQSDWNTGGRSYVNYVTISNYFLNMLRRGDIMNQILDIESLARLRFSSASLNWREFNRGSFRGRRYIKGDVYAVGVSRVFDLFSSIRIGVNENCSVFQRRLHFFPNHGRTIVEWSLHHDNPNEPLAAFNAAIRRLYQIDQTFNYENVNYSVLEYPPFEDFGMEPVSWDPTL